MHLQFAYFESSLVVEYLIEKHGLEALKRVLADLGIGLSINESLQRVTGSLDALDQEFEQFARERAAKLAPDATWDAMEDSDNASLTELAEWLTKQPNNFEGLRRYAGQLIEQSRWADAQPVLEKMIELCPDYVGSGNPYEPLAAIYRRSGDAPRERAALENVASRKGDAADAFLRLMELAQSADDSEAVLLNADRMLATNPLVPAPHRYLGEAAERLGKTDRAIAAYRALLEMDPADPAEMHFRLARNLHQAGASQEAQRQVLMALEEAPRFQDAHRLLLSIVEEQQGPAEKPAGNDASPHGEGGRR